MKLKSLAILLFIYLVFLTLCLKISFLSDDAFISYRYAKNFLDGNGLVFNPGEIVEGYTNFLWVMVSASLMKFNLDPLGGTRILTLIFSFLTLLVTYLISIKIFNVNGWISFLGVSLLAFNPGFVLWSYSGMETIFFTLLITTGSYFILSFISQNKTKSLYLASLFFSIAALTRPEGVYFFILNFLFAGIFLIVNSKEKNRTGGLKKIFIPALIFILVYGIYFYWRYSYYGFILPNTFYAKTGFDDQISRGIYYCYKFYRESLFMGMLLIFPAYLIIKEFRNVKILYMTFIITGFTVYIILIGGDNLLVQRFFIPVMPLVFTMIMLGMRRSFMDFNFPKSLRIIIAAIIISSTIFVLLDSRTFPMYGVSRTLTYYETLKKAGLWLKENSKPGESLAVESAGIIPYYSGLKSYDRLGLSDLHISHSGKYDKGARDKNDEEYILAEKKPDYFVDAFPTLEKKQKPDLIKGDVVYKYHSVPIGKGVIEDKPGVKEDGELHFNFYKLEK